MHSHPQGLRPSAAVLARLTLLLTATVCWSQLAEPVGEPMETRLGCFVYLVDGTPSRVDDIIASLTSLDRNFNAWHRYPVVVFVPSAKREGGSIIASGGSLLLSEAQQQRIVGATVATVSFAEVDFEALVDPAQLVAAPSLLFGRFGMGYRHMCNFFAGPIAMHPALAPYRYYWRQDTDSQLVEPLGADPFLEMAKHSWRYGYALTQCDWHVVTEGLYDLADQHFGGTLAARLLPEFVDGSCLRGSSAGEQAAAYNNRVYYNNFEVVDLAFMRSPAYQAFYNATAQAGGIFTQRWGDAPIRTLAVQALLAADAVHRFVDISYYHQGMYGPIVSRLFFAAGMATALALAAISYFAREEIVRLGSQLRSSIPQPVRGLARIIGAVLDVGCCLQVRRCGMAARRRRGDAHSRGSAVTAARVRSLSSSEAGTVSERDVDVDAPHGTAEAVAQHASNPSHSHTRVQSKASGSRHGTRCRRLVRLACCRPCTRWLLASDVIEYPPPAYAAQKVSYHAAPAPASSSTHSRDDPTSGVAARETADSHGEPGKALRSETTAAAAMSSPRTGAGVIAGTACHLHAETRPRHQPSSPPADLGAANRSGDGELASLHAVPSTLHHRRRPSSASQPSSPDVFLFSTAESGSLAVSDVVRRDEDGVELRTAEASTWRSAGERGALLSHARDAHDDDARRPGAPRTDNTSQQGARHALHQTTARALAHLVARTQALRSLLLSALVASLFLLASRERLDSITFEGSVPLPANAMRAAAAPAPRRYCFPDELRCLLEQHADYRRRVVVTGATSGMLDFVQNLLHSLHRVGIFNHLVFALDAGAADFLVSRGVPVYWDPTPIQALGGGRESGDSAAALGGLASGLSVVQAGAGAQTDTALKFGSKAYQAVTMRKNELIYEVLRYGYNAFFTDADTVWLRNPFDEAQHGAEPLWADEISETAAAIRLAERGALDPSVVPLSENFQPTAPRFNKYLAHRCSELRLGDTTAGWGEAAGGLQERADCAVPAGYSYRKPATATARLSLSVASSAGGIRRGTGAASLPPEPALSPMFPRGEPFGRYFAITAPLNGPAREPLYAYDVKGMYGDVGGMDTGYWYIRATPRSLQHMRNVLAYQRTPEGLALPSDQETFNEVLKPWLPEHTSGAASLREWLQRRERSEDSAAAKVAALPFTASEVPTAINSAEGFGPARMRVAFFDPMQVPNGCRLPEAERRETPLLLVHANCRTGWWEKVPWMIHHGFWFVRLWQDKHVAMASCGVIALIALRWLVAVVLIASGRATTPKAARAEVAL